MGRSLIAASVLACGTFMTGVNLYAQGKSLVLQTRPSYEEGDKKKDHPHNGPTGQSVVTGNGINYNGGPVMNPVNLYFILYGNWSGGDSTGPAILETWAQNIGPSPYFNINTTYGDSAGVNVPNLVTYEGVHADTGSLGTSLSDASIGTLASNAINAGFPGAPVPAGTADPNGVYMVLTAPGVAETSGFLTSYCGWHWSGSFVSGAITEGYLYSGYPVVKFAFIGNAAGPSFGACAVQSTSPNGDAGADAMISVMAHELSESATDPEGNAWYSSSGEEMADLCAWNFGATGTAPNGSSYNVTLNGIRYLMQQLWLNANGGACALSYAPAGDFSVSVSGSQTVYAGGPAAPYTATAADLNGFTGTVTWTYAPPSGIILTPTGATTGNSFPFTLAAASTLAPGTYSVPITGTSGALVHSVNATLVVSAGDFSASVSGSQSVAPGGTTGNYTLNYTPINGFNGTVTWTFASKSGITVKPAASPLTGNGATFTLTAASSLAAGTYTLQVTGKSGTLSHAVNATLVVTTPDFSVAVSGSQSVAAGGTTGNYTLNYTPINGFSGTVTWTFASKSGITVTAANPLTGNGATFTLTAASTLAPGTYSLQVTGTSGTLSHSVNASLVVTAPPSFTLSITPSSQNVTPPSSGTVTVTYTVNITPTGGFAGTVTLKASGGESHVTPSIVGSPVTVPGGSGTLSVAVTSGAKKGGKTLTVTGTATGVSGSPSATASISVK